MMNTLFRIFMILILLLVIGSILYFGLTRNDNDDVVIPVEEEKLNLSSGIVKSLYSYVENDYRCSNTLAVEEEFNKNVSVIDYDTKFMMAVSIMLDSDRDKLFCNDYEPSLFFKTDINSNYGCGDNYYNENTKKFDVSSVSLGYTTFLKEDNVKKRFEQIFGRFSYDPKDLIRNSDSWYRYLIDEDGFVLLNIKDDSTCVNHINTLNKAIVLDDNIILTVEKEFIHDDESSAIYDFMYTFSLDSDNSYYLTNVKSVRQK